MTTLRDALPADAPAVAEMHVRSWQVAYRGLLPGRYPGELRAADRAARYPFGGAPGDPSTIVAVRDGAVCGSATVGTLRLRRALPRNRGARVQPDRPTRARTARARVRCTASTI